MYIPCITVTELIHMYIENKYKFSFKGVVTDQLIVYVL